ncbi:IclR family transcriptional regulator [Microbacterium sp. YY-01]|uniref:IclR family transcriptional regulator n=1 Tax=Microbacterium sp. YY-01 TaxID=3421634 RepID=UPI003D1765D1
MLLNISSTPKRLSGKRKHMDRAVTILEAVAASQTPIGVSHLSESLSLPLASTYRQLQKLTDSGLLVQNPATNKYSLGERAIHLANKIVVHRGGERSRAVLREVNEETTFSTLVGRFSGTSFTYVENLPSTSSMSVSGVIGTPAPLHATSIGKGILSLLDESIYRQTVAQLSLDSFSKRTITTVAQLDAEIARVRDIGFAQSHAEYEARVGSVAVPFRVEQGPQSGIYALCIAGHISEMDQLMACLDKLRDAAYRLGGLM